MTDTVKRKDFGCDVCGEVDCDFKHECEESQCKTESGIFSKFRFTTLTPNISGVVTIPIPVVPPNEPVVLATLKIKIDDPKDVVWLTGVVGWNGVTNGTGVGKIDAIFSIFRNAPNTTTGQLIFSTRQSTEAFPESEFETASIDHVDKTPLTSHSQRTVTYFLTAQLPLPGSTGNVIGPITFTAAEIERKSKHESDD